MYHSKKEKDMAVVVDFADCLEEFKYGQSFIEAISEVSAYLGRRFDTLDTNMHDDMETFDNGPRTEASWNLPGTPIVSMVTVSCMPDWEYGSKKGSNPIVVELHPRCLESFNANGISSILESKWLEVRMSNTLEEVKSLGQLWEELQHADRNNGA
tara:strand:- start:449 stop:913 length:465 start_codon:yes stop_codon:yes gene_type:complete